ncbi:Hypothetical protein A9601_03871 [Prochlorococcus marinus str. AS9601]|uniref:Uncharacterized protein n=1 Tax=Prochlorococcus marinus (strain AS9601) TaxID=146891 RepID=A2BPG4_PROMS|nr:Hypothetical protein A9601_03871 [Prochlorococcus marinus str. AS9601]
MISNCQIKIKLNPPMNFEAGIRLIIFLVIFGFTNYLNDVEKI